MLVTMSVSIGWLKKEKREFRCFLDDGYGDTRVDESASLFEEVHPIDVVVDCLPHALHVVDADFVGKGNMDGRGRCRIQRAQS